MLYSVPLHAQLKLQEMRTDNVLRVVLMPTLILTTGEFWWTAGTMSNSYLAIVDSLYVAGAVWTDASCDNNDTISTIHVSPFVSMYKYIASLILCYCVFLLPVETWEWKIVSISGICVWLCLRRPEQLALHSAHLKSCASHWFLHCQSIC